MQFVGKVLTSVSEFYKDINPSTLSGAIDVLVVEDAETKGLTCSPFHVRFGKLQLLRPQEKIVEITINGKTIDDVRMKVGEAGETFFVLPVSADEEVSGNVPPEYMTSPLAVPLTNPPAADAMDQLSLSATDAKSVASESELDDRTRRRSRLSSTLSDSELEVGASSGLSESQVVPSSPPKWTWMWGGLPTREKGPSPPQEAAALLSPPKSVSPDPQVPLFEHLEQPAHLLSTLQKVASLVERAGAPNVSVQILTAADVDGPLLAMARPDIAEPAKMLDFVQRSLKPMSASAFFRDVSALSSRFSVHLYSSKADPNETPLFLSGRTAYLASLGIVLFGAVPPVQTLELASVGNVGSVGSVESAGKPVPVPATDTKRSSWRQWWSSKSTATPPLELEQKGPTPDEKAASSPDLPIRTPLEKHYKKSLRLPSAELRKLNLQYGLNTISFSVVTSRQGRATCSARIFLWRSNVRIVISDIDGTITKSDALGHLFTFVGKDWTHLGVAKLFSDISRNSYRFIYLTSRAIGQADSTRVYLRGIEQNKYQLPDGPVIMSPDRFFAAVRRELIEGNPEEFKIACLLDVRRLFQPPGNPAAANQPATKDSMPINPFYAGFGNRITDALSYRSVGVLPSRIFTINSAGDLRLELVSGYTGSYVRLTDMVDQIFPPLDLTMEDRPPSTDLQIDEPYTDFFYWKRCYSISILGEVQTAASAGDHPISSGHPQPKAPSHARRHRRSTHRKPTPLVTSTVTSKHDQLPGQDHAEESVHPDEDDSSSFTSGMGTDDYYEDEESLIPAYPYV